MKNNIYNNVNYISDDIDETNDTNNGVNDESDASNTTPNFIKVLLGGCFICLFVLFTSFFVVCKHVVTQTNNDIYETNDTQQRHNQST